MHSKPTLVRTSCILVIALLATGLSACDSPTATEDDLLTRVKNATAQFTSSTAAIDAGYTPDEHCVAHPDLGGMGQHWVNQDLVDPTFDAMQPEALLYEPTAGGLQLVGVEYIVINAGQPRPEFDGQPFDEGGVPPLMEAGVPHWSLHVWAHRDNPSGTFAPFNPAVTCE